MLSHQQVIVRLRAHSSVAHSLASLAIIWVSTCADRCVMTTSKHGRPELVVGESVVGREVRHDVAAQNDMLSLALASSHSISGGGTTVIITHVEY